MTRGVVNNLLPVEVREAGGRRALGLGDVKLALEMGGDRAIGQMPTVVESVMGAWPEGVLEGWGRHPDFLDEEDEMERSGPRVNGVLTNGVLTNGISHSDNDNWGWEGGAARDRDKLFSVLDDCLAVGQ